MKNVYRFSFRLLSAVVVLAFLATFPMGCSDDPTAPTVNHAPVVNSVACSPAQLSGGGGTVTVTVSATDQDNDKLTYTYSASLGTVAPGGAVTTWSVPGTEGAHIINVSVSDGQLNATGLAGVSVAAAVTQITGTLSLAPGAAGDLGNTQVAIYTSIAQWIAYSPFLHAAAAGTGASVNYTITNVPPGAYFLDTWKDNDGNLFWSVGDFVGWYGSGLPSAPTLSQFGIVQGETKVINVSNIIPIP